MIERVTSRNSLVGIVLSHSLEEIDGVVVAVNAMRQHLSLPFRERGFVVGHLIDVLPHGLVRRSKLPEDSVELVDFTVPLEHWSQHHLLNEKVLINKIDFKFRTHHFRENATQAPDVDSG